MKKLLLIATISILGACANIIPLPENTSFTANGNISNIKFDWKTNASIERLELCTRKHMPVNSFKQTQDVIRSIDKKNNEILGYGSFVVNNRGFRNYTHYPRFKFNLSKKNGEATLIFYDILSSVSANGSGYGITSHDMWNPEFMYQQFEDAAKNIEACL